MGHHDAAGEQVQAVLEAARQLPVLHVEILGVADDRVTDMGGMRPQLMRAPRDRLQGQPGKLLGRRLDHGVVGERVARALLAVAGHAHAGIALAALLLDEVGRDAALPDPGHAGDQRPVDLSGRAGTEGLGERHRREAGLCDDEAARGVLVQPVHEARLLARLVAQGLEQAVDVALGGRAALDGKAEGLVEHQHVGVLIEGDRAEKGSVVALARRAAGGNLRRIELERGHADRLPGVEPLARLHALHVHAQLAFAHDALDMGEGEPREAGDEEAVDAHPLFIRPHGERLDAGGEGVARGGSDFALRRRARDVLGGLGPGLRISGPGRRLAGLARPRFRPLVRPDGASPRRVARPCAPDSPDSVRLGPSSASALAGRAPAASPRSTLPHASGG
jgi:hypothetical protein